MRRPRRAWTSMAITDHGALYGAVAFYQAARTKGIKPIIGVETYVAPPLDDRPRRARPTAQPFHLILLAKDYTGYQNLCRLVTDAHIDGYYYKPRIDREHLAKYSEGLIGLSACLGGEVARALEVDDWDLARTVAGRVRRHLRARTASSSSSRTTACPSSAGSTSSSCASRPRSACRSSSRTTCTTSARTSPRRTTCCCASGTGNNLDTPGRLKFETHEFYVKSAAADGARCSRTSPTPITNTPAHRGDDRPRAAARPAADPALPGARRRDRRVVARARSASAASSGATGRSRRSSSSASTTSSASSPRWATPATSSSSRTSSGSPGSRASRRRAAAARRARS